MFTCSCASEDCRVNGCMRLRQFRPWHGPPPPPQVIPPVIAVQPLKEVEGIHPKDVPQDIKEKSLQQRIEALENAVWAFINNPGAPYAAADEAEAYMLTKEGRD